MAIWTLRSYEKYGLNSSTHLWIYHFYQLKKGIGLIGNHAKSHYKHSRLDQGLKLALEVTVRYEYFLIALLLFTPAG